MSRTLRPSRASSRASTRASMRGMTLIELLIAMAILAFISIMMYSAVDGMRRSREGVDRISDRYREGRMALARISRELNSAYLSEHAPINPSLRVMKTIFKGERGSPASRLDFNTFSNRRVQADARESDQLEVSYFGSEDPDERGVHDLARRASTRVDDKPQEGGRVDVLATNIDLFSLEYLDPLTGKWREDWDTTSTIAQKGRLPLQTKVVLVLNDVQRNRSGGSRGKLRLVTKVNLYIQDVLTFALK
ncbi:MAG TPA: type II secretion system protein GspJ [Polyangiaceae bacterium]|nr:type II secretion system protein GspJ [Polyangiaceae bacterium]